MTEKGEEFLKAARKYLVDYPDSPYRDVTLFRIAQVELQQGRPGQSEKALEDLKAKHPNSCYIRRARKLEYEIAEYRYRHS